MDTDLGECEQEFGFNQQEWERYILVFGYMIGMGVLGLAMVCYDFTVNGFIDWILLLVSPILAVLGGGLLFHLRPGILSVELCKEDLRVNERHETSSFPWREIAKIEESHQLSKSRDVHQIFIERSDELGFLVNSLTLESFDNFLEMLRKKALEFDIEWQRIENGDSDSL